MWLEEQTTVGHPAWKNECWSLSVHLRLVIQLKLPLRNRIPFLERPVNLWGPKSNSWNRIICPLWKAALLICFRYTKGQNDCQVSKMEICPYWRYKVVYVTGKISGHSRNRPQKRRRLLNGEQYVHHCSVVWSSLLSHSTICLLLKKTLVIKKFCSKLFKSYFKSQLLITVHPPKRPYTKWWICYLFCYWDWYTA